jgi:hypothetical protein
LPLLLLPLPSFNKREPITQVAMIFVVTVIMGILVELSQSAFSRTPDMGDLYRNLIGAGIAICFILPVRKTFSATSMRIFKPILIILVMLQLYPMATALIDEHQARRQFPVLSDFQAPLQLDRWRSDVAISIENDIGHQGNCALRVDLDTQLYSGFALEYFQKDWQQYRWFQYRIYNPSEDAIRITCRIHDKKHIQGIQRYEDRFNITHSISSGWHTITISLDDIRMAPAEREMDLSQIYGVGFFASRLPCPKTIYVDDVKLFKKNTLSNPFTDLGVFSCGSWNRWN